MRSSRHSTRNRIETLLSAAARRRALAIALEQAAGAVALVLAGAILLLLLGTQILAWYWLALLAALGVALIAVRVRSRPIPRYRLAQILDYRLKLSDSLSTAWFLLSHSRGDPAARFQIEHAQQVAESVQPAAAFPFLGSRSWALAAALAAVAFGLFAVRYLVLRSLNFDEALVPIHLGPVLEALEEPFSADASKSMPAQPSALSRSAQSQPQDGRTDSLRPQAPQSGNPAETPSSQAAAFEDSQSQPDSTATSRGQPSNTQAAHKGGQPEPDGQDRVSQPSPREQASLEQNSPRLMDKMRDALSSLMAKMRPEGASHPERREASSPEQQKSSAQSALGKDQHGNQQNARGDRASAEQSTEGQAQGQTTEKTQASQARNSNQSSEHKGSDSQSGVGRQDGDKQIKEAEQLRAMGRLAEIIGKRSANLTGDMVVETSSGNQELKTQYSQRLGHHSDLGGEINRDEIPLIYQQYIRDYMEEVRKQQHSTSPP